MCLSCLLNHKRYSVALRDSIYTQLRMQLLVKGQNGGQNRVQNKQNQSSIKHQMIKSAAVPADAVFNIAIM